MMRNVKLQFNLLTEKHDTVEAYCFALHYLCLVITTETPLRI